MSTKQLRNIQLSAAAAQLPPALVQHIKTQGIEEEKAVQLWPYFSTIRRQAVRTGAGPYVYTLASGAVRAFGYKVGDDLAQAGFTSGTPATFAETNLTAGGSQTNENALVKIFGVCAELCPGSEPLLAEKIWRGASVRLSLGGSYTYTVGPLSTLPQPGGLFGVARSLVRPGALEESSGSSIGFASNGNPHAQSFRPLKYPLLWQPQGAGKDSSLAISVETYSPIVYAGADRAAAAGVEAFTAAETSYAEIRFWLVAMQIGDRSTNA